MSVVLPYDGPFAPPLEYGPDTALFWDPSYFFPRYVKVAPKEGGAAIPFRLWAPQKVLAANAVLAMQQNKRLIHVKCRKEGSSSFFGCMAMQHVCFRRGCQAAIVAQRDDISKQIARTVVRAYNSLPDWMRPERRERVERSLDIPALDSFLSLATAGQSDPARGFTGLQFLLATEISSWKSADTWVSLLSNLPREGAFVVAESTPLHQNDELHRLWKQADQPDSPWHKVFLPWTMMTDYEAPPPPGWVPSEVVRDYADKYKLNPRQAYWMQAWGLPNCANKIERFKAEYPIDELSAWSELGTAVFNLELLQARFSELGQENEQLGDTRVFKEPEEGHRYVIAVDPASSFSKRDYFGIQCLDMTTCEQVWESAQHGDAYQIARMLVHLGKKYNEALIACEANGVGDGLLLCLVNLGYRRIYYRGKGKEAKPGWWSDQRRKVEAFTIAQELIEDGSFAPNSHRLIRQMIESRGPMEKQGRDSEGGHYDLVSAICLALWMYKHEFGGASRSKQTNAKDLAAKAWKSFVRRFSGDDAGNTVEDRFGIHRML